MTPPSDGHGRDAAGRLFGLLLALFPAEFRSAYGGEMREVFAAQRHAARAAGIRARTRLWARTVAGMTIAAWRERRPRKATASNAWNPVLRWPAAALAEIGYAVRRLARARGYACAVIATLALCIGANLTIFAAVDAIILRGLPFPDAARLVTIYNTYPRASVPDDGASVANYYERRTGIAAFSSVSLYKTDAVIVGDTGSTEREPVMRVSPEFFTTLGVTPMLGRVFREEETTPATAGVVLLSEPYWREQLAGDRTVIGRSIRINGTRLTIVGVLPAGFAFLGSRARLFLPYASEPDDRRSARRHSGSASQMVARLAPGVTLDEAQRQIDAHNGIMEREDPERGMMIDAGFRSVVVSLHRRHVETVRPSLLLLQAGALVLFAIGLVNVGNLFLVRAGSRAKELAVRRAIGARVSHIAGSVLAETLLLSACGALAGLVVAEAGVGLLGTLGASRLPLGSQITLDATSIVAAAAAALVAGLILGAVTTAHQCATDAGDVLRSETRGATAGRRSERARHAIVVAQVALSFVLLASAVLLTSSVRHLMRVSPGFDSGQVFTAQVTLPFPRYGTDAALRSFVDRLVRELAMVPGLSASGIATNVPLSGNAIKSAASIVGRPVRPGEPPHGVYAYAVAGEFFAAMKIPLHEGRYLRPSDAGAAARACVVDETFARAHWRSGGAVGQRLFLGSSEGPIDEAYTIVGVVGEVKQASLSEQDGNGAVYYPYSDRFDRAIYIVTRTTVPPDSIQSAVRQAVRRIDPELPLNNARSMDARIDDSLIAQRSPALFGLVFSGVALALTALGTFGAISYAVALRRREIGVRLALGARPRQVGARFVALGARLLAAGLTLGVGSWWAVSRALAAWLAGLPSAPASATVLATAVMGTVCVLACAIPARRAMRMSPIDALQD